MGGNIVTDAFGVVAMVAMTPLITIQVLGLVYQIRSAKVSQVLQLAGVYIAAEKEIIFIVTKSKGKNDIMKAIMEKAGMDSQAKSIVFSLPVTSTAGLRLQEEDRSEEI